MDGDIREFVYAPILGKITPSELSVPLHHPAKPPHKAKHVMGQKRLTWHWHGLKIWTCAPYSLLLVWQSFCVDGQCWTMLRCPTHNIGLTSLKTTLCQGISSFLEVFQILAARYQAQTGLTFWDTWPMIKYQSGDLFFDVFDFLGKSL